MPPRLTSQQRSFVAQTRLLLARRPRSIEYAHISATTGVPVCWIKEFARCRYDNPKLSHVVSIERFLTAKRDA